VVSAIGAIRWFEDVVAGLNLAMNGEGVKTEGQESEKYEHYYSLSPYLPTAYSLQPKTVQTGAPNGY